MVRCVDDSLLHDKDLEEHWWRVIAFLELAGNGGGGGGIVLNAEKFQFSQTTVDFAGFRIADENVEPLPKYLDAIRGYPTPANITDIRSWFGLVNQVSHYSQLRVMMEPFRKFLSQLNLNGLMNLMICSMNLKNILYMLSKKVSRYTTLHDEQLLDQTGVKQALVFGCFKNIVGVHDHRQDAVRMVGI